MTPAEIMAPHPGERLLDLCAAPGGKSTHLAALMQNQGLLISNEIHPGRVWELAENLERWGVCNAAITNETPERLAQHFGAFFDRVLVDAPCSGEGMFRKSAAARQDWSLALVQGCAARQGEILRQAARLVKPGGWLVYSTCTFNPTENEEVIGKFLNESSGIYRFELGEPPRRLGFSSGKPEWMVNPQPELDRAVRLWPHHAPGEGHFVALMKNASSSDPLNVGDLRKKWNRCDPAARKLVETFCGAALNISFDPERLAQVGSYLYLLPQGLPGLSGLKVAHPGWWLGTLKKGRFEPAHGLALGLKKGDARQSLDFQADDPRLAAYWRGETLASAGEDGWLLVCVDGFPFGWGRRAQGIVKNYYPKGLRKLRFSR